MLAENNFKLLAKDGLLTSVRQLRSSFCDERPANSIIDTIVIHGISLPPNEFGGGYIEKFFCGNLDFSLHPYFATIADLRVSSHLLIDRTGLVTQFVPFNKRAWHAGKSFFKGKEQCNDFSIGIELEGTDNLAYTDDQYKNLSSIVKLLMTHYKISSDNIVGHSDIAPKRKTDPGPAFDWLFFRSLLK